MKTLSRRFPEFGIQIPEFEFLVWRFWLWVAGFEALALGSCLWIPGSRSWPWTPGNGLLVLLLVVDSCRGTGVLLFRDSTMRIPRSEFLTRNSWLYILGLGYKLRTRVSGLLVLDSSFLAVGYWF